jgi:hypothetical protein
MHKVCCRLVYCGYLSPTGNAVLDGGRLAGLVGWTDDQHQTRCIITSNWGNKPPNLVYRCLLVGGLETWYFMTFQYFPLSWECHHPNRLSHIFQRARDGSEGSWNQWNPAMLHFAGGCAFASDHFRSTWPFFPMCFHRC